MDVEAITNGKTETYHNVTHVSVVGSWLYLTMATGEWAKLDSRDVTVEISAINSPDKKQPAKLPASTPEIERLRLSMLQESIHAMAGLSNAALVDFMAVERRRIINICLAEARYINGLLMLEL